MLVCEQLGHLKCVNEFTRACVSLSVALAAGVSEEETAVHRGESISDN